jgi:hypothetical protein
MARATTILVAVAAISANALAGLLSGHTIAANGVRVVAPQGWTRAAAASAGPATDPRTLLVVGTTGVRPRTSRCQIAAYTIPPRGAVVVIVGWRSLRYSGAENAKPGRAPLRRLTRVRTPSCECFGGRGAATDLVLHGTAYQVNVMVGGRASHAIVEQALAIGRSFDRIH